jgi:hypothetical protein
MSAPRAPRIDGWAVNCKVSSDTHNWHEVTAKSVNGNGITIQTANMFAVGDKLLIDLRCDPVMPILLEPIHEKTTGTIVWAQKSSYGVKFAEPSTRLNVLAEEVASRYS